jgi:phosphohistidine swiveling domain-containing protein
MTSSPTNDPPIIGKSVAKHEPVDGSLRRFDNTGDVAAALADDLSDTIAVVRAAGVSLLSPIIADVAGVICAAEGEGSHLAIMAREFDIPCLMGVSLDKLTSGKRVRLDCAGALDEGQVQFLGDDS